MKLKKYRVTCMVSNYGTFECLAASKFDATVQAYAADRKGDIFYGDAEMEVVECIVPVERRKK